MKIRFLALAFLAACGTGPHPLTPPLEGDAGDLCPLACARLDELGCPEATTNAAGETCPAVCLRADALVSPACIAAASTRAELAPCHVRCVQ